MRSQIPVGRFFGIRTGLHYSWFLIALLMLLSFSAIFHRQYPASGEGLITAWALATTLLFFVSLLLHELSHCMVALRYGLRVREITLFALGGVSQIEGELPSAAAEFRIAIAGPLTSALIGVVCAAAARIPIVVAMGQPATMFSWLAYINLTIAAFNLLPGYPMDGGRVLRAFLWWRTKDPTRASEGAARTGQSIGIALIVLGGLELLAGSGAGLWLAFVGWFVYSGAGTERWAARARHLTGVRVRDVMQRDPMIVPQWWTVRSFLDHLTPDHAGQSLYPLVDFEGASAGAVTMADLHRAGLAASDRQVREFARRRVLTVTPDAYVADLLMPLRLAGGTAVVVEDGRPVGLLTESDLIQAMRLSELGWRQPATSAS